MDETTFQQELNDLKLRMAGLMMERQPDTVQNTVTHPGHIRDSLLDQLQDLKGHAFSVHERLTESLRELLVSQSPVAPLVAASTTTSTAAPSVSDLWQMLQAIRTDLSELDTRVCCVEKTTCSLEDTVDRMDRTHCSPAASEDLELPIQNSENNGQSSCAHQTSATSCISDLGSIRFRDREIARLEELLRDTQNDLRMAECVLANKESENQQLRDERLCLLCCSKINDRSQGHNGAQRRPVDTSAVERSNVTPASSKFATWISPKAAQVRKERVQKMKLLRLRQEVDSIRENLAEHKVFESEGGISQAPRTFEGNFNTHGQSLSDPYTRIAHLQRSCRVQQELITSQTQLLEERRLSIWRGDVQNEHLSREAKASKDNHTHMIREYRRCARLLEERDDEIARLKASLNATASTMPIIETGTGSRQSTQWIESSFEPVPASPKTGNLHAFAQTNTNTVGGPANPTERKVAYDMLQPSPAMNCYTDATADTRTSPPISKAGLYVSHLRAKDSSSALQRTGSLEKNASGVLQEKRLSQSSLCSPPWAMMPTEKHDTPPTLSAARTYGNEPFHATSPRQPPAPQLPSWYYDSLAETRNAGDRPPWGWSQPATLSPVGQESQVAQSSMLGRDIELAQCATEHISPPLPNGLPYMQSLRSSSHRMDDQQAHGWLHQPQTASAYSMHF